MAVLIDLAERGILPDPLVRFGIRRLLRTRLADINELEGQEAKILRRLEEEPIAEATNEANEQHYELPPEFFEKVLGKHLKYSSALFQSGTANLDQAEEAMLELYLERAQLSDGQSILELGCGWGSLSLFMAARFPNSSITVVSNSRLQKTFIDKKAKERGLTNLTVVTADMNEFEPTATFDRIVSIEMFEHMRNYPTLFKRLHRWLKEEGLLFIHIFCHEQATYFFETEGDDNWMGRYFFTGGVMPGFDLFEKVQKDFSLVEKWKVNGSHYQKTAEAWLENMDRRQGEILPILTRAYGEKEARRWFQRWRIFFASCAELFGFQGGDTWFVGHYLFKR